MKYLASAVLGAILAAAASAFIYVQTYPHEPHCPQEDSCTVDYSHGAWTVTEVTP